MSGWFKCPADAWPVLIADRIESGEAWPAELVVGDLAWMEDRRRMTGMKIPGYRRLMKRWGWSEYQTRRAMREHLGGFTAPSPHLHRTFTAPSPHDEPKEGDKDAETTAPSPHLHRTFTAPTSTRAYVDQTQTTDTDSDKKEIVEPDRAPAPHEPAEAPASASAEGPVSPHRGDTTADRVDAVAAEWWRLWGYRREKHPEGAPRSERLPKLDRQAIEAVVKGKSPKITVDEAIMICRWAFYGDDWHAQHLRGEHEGQTINVYLSPSSAYKTTKLGEKLHKARLFIERHERQRSESDRQTRVDPEYKPRPFDATPPPPDFMRRLRERIAANATP